MTTRQQAQLAAEFHEARTHLADGSAVVLAEVGNRLVIGGEPAQQPHYLDVAASLALQPTTRLHPVEIAVDVELQESRSMIGRPAGCRRLHLEAQLGQTEHLDESIDHANRITLVDEVIEAFRQQCRLGPIRLRNETLHLSPRRITRGIIESHSFSHSQGHVYA
jgi:hypothetical protein